VGNGKLAKTRPRQSRLAPTRHATRPLLHLINKKNGKKKKKKGKKPKKKKEKKKKNYP
jgi:hypothetical protein